MALGPFRLVRLKLRIACFRQLRTRTGPVRTAGHADFKIKPTVGWALF